MTSPTPPSSIDGGDRREAVEPPAEATSSRPNYLVRRGIAIAAVVAVLAGGSVIADRIIGGGNDGDGGTPVSADWNSVVVVADDEVRVVDPDTGDVTSTHPTETPLGDAPIVVTGHTVLTINEFGRITELDLRDGTIRRSTAANGSELLLSGDNAGIVLAGPPTGGDVTVVDTTDGVSLDIGSVAQLIDPLMFAGEVFVDESGRHVATADARSFQSVLVDIEEGTALPLAGQVVALDDDTVVTAQRAGDRAELEFYDLQGERRGAVDGPAPRAIMLTGPSTALVVSPTGTIAAVGANGDVEEVGAVAPPSGSEAIEILGGTPAVGADRLLLRTDDGMILLDAEGTELARAPGELLTPLTRTSACAVIGVARRTGQAAHLDLDTGEVLGEFAGGTVESSSADGCTTAMSGDATRIVVRGVERPAGISSSTPLLITPDGEAYITTTATGRHQLESLDDEDDAEPVLLATGPVQLHFAEL